MRRSLPCLVRSAAVLILLLFGATDWSRAGALDPLGFQSLGTFPTAAGEYTFNTTGPSPTLTGPGPDGRL